MTATLQTLLRRAALLFSTALLSVSMSGCGHLSVPTISMPKVSLPKLPSLSRDEDKPKDLSATPRDLLTA